MATTFPVTWPAFHGNLNLSRNSIHHSHDGHYQIAEIGQEENDSIEKLKEKCGFNYEGHELGTCSVCLEDLSGKLIRASPCSHHYHEACIVSWLKKHKSSCPLCRSKIL